MCDVGVVFAPEAEVRRFRGARKLINLARALRAGTSDLVVLAAPEGQGERLASKLVSDNWLNEWRDTP